MSTIDDVWIMQGLDYDDPDCIITVDEMDAYIDQVGFLPLFRNEIDDFSVEEVTASESWWMGDDSDPWVWREVIARRGNIAYGKLFHNKAGFISKEWLPYFANYRRDGYDFDSLYEDGKAEYRAKKIMDLFELKDEYYSFELKELAGFGKGGEKNFAGVLTKLQMQTYLVNVDFRQRINKKGMRYGMPTAIMKRPEDVWGYDFVTSAYDEDPEKSAKRIADHVKELCIDATDEEIRRVCL